jgi:hypothetical protein
MIDISKWKEAISLVGPMPFLVAGCSNLSGLFLRDSTRHLIVLAMKTNRSHQIQNSPQIA